MARQKKAKGEAYFKAFPTNLRDIMHEKGTTQQELADYLGLSRQSVSLYCDGSSTPNWETLAKIARFFGVSSDWLLGVGEQKINKSRFPEFTERFREIVGERSATDFARAAGLSRQTVGFYLNGDLVPDAETLKKICIRCGVSADWLIGTVTFEEMKTGEVETIQKAIGGIESKIIAAIDDMTAMTNAICEWFTDYRDLHRKMERMGQTIRKELGDDKSTDS